MIVNVHGVLITKLLQNPINFVVENSSLYHADNRKNNLSVLCEVPTSGINRSFGSLEKKLALLLVNQIENFTRFCFIVLIIVNACLIIEKKSLNSKLTIRRLSFQLSFVSKVYLMDLVLLSLENVL